jgi:hypothetical protein
LRAALLVPLTATGRESVATLTPPDSREVQPRRGPEYTCADVADGLNGGLEVRHALTAYMRAKVADPESGAALIQNMAHHPEWKAVPGR